MLTKKQIGERLREFRKAEGLGQSDVASAIGVSSKTISAWERGDRQPNAEKLMKLCTFFGADFIDFEEVTTGLDNLTDKEKELLGIFRNLDDDSQDAVLVTARAIINFAHKHREEDRFDREHRIGRYRDTSIEDNPSYTEFFIRNHILLNRDSCTE